MIVIFWSIIGLKIANSKNIVKIYFLIFNNVFTVSVFMFIISDNSNGNYLLNFS